MLKRKIYSDLLNWKSKKNQDCLLIKGARQIGKSFIVREFAKGNYKSYIEINFYEHPEYKTIFDGSLSATEIYKRISLAIPEVNFIEHDTLIFLDEIQHCPNARTAIKFLAIDNRYDVISSGSLLGLHYKDIVSIPVGYETQLEMFSLDFEEFLWAYGYDENAIKNLYTYFLSKKTIPDSINVKLNQLIREYIVVGGMPEVVNTFFKTNNFQEVHKKQLSILAEYEDDIRKYANLPDRQKIRDCYYSLPRQLSKEYTKFQFKVVDPNGSARKYSNAINWLLDAGMIKLIYNVSTPQLPLKAYEKPDQFKVYGTDIGLVTAMYGFETQSALVQNILKGPAKGGIYENLIFDILTKLGIPTSYLKKDGNAQEIEFLIEKDCQVVPIEVKSSRGSTMSLNEFIDEFNPNVAYKFTSTNIGKVGSLITLPHYMAIFLNK